MNTAALLSKSTLPYKFDVCDNVSQVSDDVVNAGGLGIPFAAVHWQKVKAAG